MNIGVGVSIGVWLSATRPHGGCKASWSFGRGHGGNSEDAVECVRNVKYEIGVYEYGNIGT